jgi:DNA replication protein DnaC
MDIEAEERAKVESVEEDKYALASRKRQERTDAVVLSSSPKKIVLAGPGTGKTHLFKSILNARRTHSPSHLSTPSSRIFL